jgi:hypothetical protein
LLLQEKQSRHQQQHQQQQDHDSSSLLANLQERLVHTDQGTVVLSSNQLNSSNSAGTGKHTPTNLSKPTAI